MARKRKRLTPPQRVQVKTFSEKALFTLNALGAIAKILEVLAKWFAHH